MDYIPRVKLWVGFEEDEIPYFLTCSIRKHRGVASTKSSITLQFLPFFCCEQKVSVGKHSDLLGLWR